MPARKGVAISGSRGQERGQSIAQCRLSLGVSPRPVVAIQPFAPSCPSVVSFPVWPFVKSALTRAGPPDSEHSTPDTRHSTPAAPPLPQNPARAEKIVC
jgi:hypothetical protein